MEEETGWIFDSVVQYLVSPIWRTPVCGFLDGKCIVFSTEESKENEKAYKELHEEYKVIVQFLLDSFLEDIGINGDQFVEACRQQGNDRPEAVMAAFEQVEAVRNYQLFKSIMMKRNVDLELMALRMIQERNGVLPDLMQPGEDTSVEYSQAMVDTEEEKILQLVLRQSQEEYEKQKNSKSKDIDQDLEKALANSKEEDARLRARKTEEQQLLDQVLSTSREEENRRKTQFENEEQMREKTLKLSISNSSDKASSSGLPPVKGSSKPSSSKPEPFTAASSSSTKPSSQLGAAKSPTPSAVTNADAAASWLSSAKAEAAADTGRSSRTSALSGGDPAELKKREEYLKKQREKILAMKQLEREKSLKAYTDTNANGAKARPKSARAAKQVTKGEMKIEVKTTAEQEKQLAMRKALAERLKQEVVNKK